MNHLENALDSVDACIFSSDLLNEDTNRDILKHHLERWTRALNTYTNEYIQELELAKDLNNFLN